jgi:hypothetical protein
MMSIRVIRHLTWTKKILDTRCSSPHVILRITLLISFWTASWVRGFFPLLVIIASGFPSCKNVTHRNLANEAPTIPDWLSFHQIFHEGPPQIVVTYGLLHCPAGNTHYFLSFSEHSKERFPNALHIKLRVHRVVKRGSNCSPAINGTPHTHFLVMKLDSVGCVGISGVPVTGILGVHKTTKMNQSFVAHEKKRWLANSVVDGL